MPFTTAAMESLALTQATIYTHLERFSPGALLIQGEKISWVGPQSRFVCPGGTPQVDLKGHLICPGFIDLHVHGAKGFDFSNADQSRLDQILRYHLKHGTTSLVATLMSQPHSATLAAIERLSAYNSNHGSALLGIHLEGPYLNPHKAGIHNPAALREPDSGELEEYCRAGGGRLKMITLAPELPGAQEMIRLAGRKNMVAALGHSMAGFEQAQQAVEAGANYATHLFNAMGALHHRNPGLAAYALLDQNVWTEAIADGYHLHPGMLRLIWRLKGLRMALVTDASPLAGLPDGEYDVPEQGRLKVNGGQISNSQGILAGSDLSLPCAVANMVQFCGCPVESALEMATLNPARILGLAQTKGSLAAGKDADIVVLDSKWQIKMVIKEGRVCA